jgi:hypothetical protein
MNPQDKQRFPYRALVILLIVLAAAIYYSLRVFGYAVMSDARGLSLASVLREHVPELRTPLYFPSYGNPPKPRNPSDIVLIAGGAGSRGSCSYLLMRPCQSFLVSSEILRRPEVYASLKRFLDQPCASLSAEAAAPTALVRSKENFAAIDAQERLQVARSFFRCEGKGSGKAKVILNIVDALDDPSGFSTPILEQIEHFYR